MNSSTGIALRLKPLLPPLLTEDAELELRLRWLFVDDRDRRDVVDDVDIDEVENREFSDEGLCGSTSIGTGVRGGGRSANKRTETGLNVGGFAFGLGGRGGGWVGTLGSVLPSREKVRG